MPQCTDIQTDAPMYRHTDRCPNVQTYRHMPQCTDIQTYAPMYRHTDICPSVQTYRHMPQCTDIQTYAPMYRHADICPSVQYTYITISHVQRRIKNSNILNYLYQSPKENCFIFLCILFLKRMECLCLRTKYVTQLLSCCLYFRVVTFYFIRIETVSLS